ncbi:MAG: 50S ribosomal protein L25 [Phycisphaerales bacterium]|nr:50S ribosomal protein L25 [Phycisphaerales bacterium]
MKTITIEGQVRTEFGKKAANYLRTKDELPGVIYGGKKEISFQAPKKDFKNLVYSSDFQIVDMKLGKESFKCILKDLQFDKVSDELIHIDLLELVDNKPVVAELPIKYVGNCVGVKEGGKLAIKMKTLKVKTLPKNLRESISVDITNLGLNGNLRVEDIKVENMELLNSPRIPVASVALTRQLKQEDSNATTGANASAAKPDTKATPAPASATKTPDAKPGGEKKGK